MNNKIHPTAIIDERENLGSNNIILPYTVISGPTDIGEGNIIGPHVTIGTAGENTKDPYYDTTDCQIRIGNRNIIKEFTTIQKPCYGETLLGNNIFLMNGKPQGGNLRSFI